MEDQARVAAMIDARFILSAHDELVARLKDSKRNAAELKWAREHEPRKRRYALQTPSGNVVGMGTEKPQLSRQDKRDGWRVIPLGQ